MISVPFLPRRIAIAAHPRMPEAVAAAHLMMEYLEARACQTVAGTIDDSNLRRRVQDGEFELLIAVGGDGTVLRAGHLCAPVGVPVLGVNMGRLGFLIQVGQDWPHCFDLLLAGQTWMEERMMLRAEHVRSETTLGSWHALNEVVVCRGATVRPVRLAASVDGHFLAAYVADGLIASTATGSTAYALAAGGPILPPELRNILLVPIAPHLSVDRAVVLSEGTTVSITVHTGEAVISVDGQPPVPLTSGDRVDVRASEYVTRLVRFGDPSYFYRNLTAHMNQNPSAEGIPK